MKTMKDQKRWLSRSNSKKKSTWKKIKRSFKKINPLLFSKSFSFSSCLFSPFNFVVVPNDEVYKSSSLQEAMKSSHQAKNEKTEDGSWRLNFSLLSFFLLVFYLFNLVILLDDEGCNPPSSSRINRVNPPRKEWQGRLKILEDYLFSLSFSSHISAFHFGHLPSPLCLWLSP